MGTPQIILLVLLGIELLLTAYRHGQARNTEYSIFWRLVDSAVLIWILVSGGFFG